jgi:hypothetical protein
VPVASLNSSLSAGESIKLCDLNNSSSCSNLFAITVPTTTDEITLSSVVINGSNVDVSYYKNFSTCAHLKMTSNNELVHTQNHFCTTGTVTQSAPLSDFSSNFVSGTEVKLCHGNDGNICSNAVSVSESSNSGSSGSSSSDGSSSSSGGASSSSSGGSSSSSITCTSPKVNDSAFPSQCVCPSGNQYDFGDSCLPSCPAGSTITNITGTSTTSTTYSCVCNAERTQNGLTCDCPSGQIEDSNGNCVAEVNCTSPKILDSDTNTCICPTGQIEDSNGNCITPISGSISLNSITKVINSNYSGGAALSVNFSKTMPECVHVTTADGVSLHASGASVTQTCYGSTNIAITQFTSQAVPGTVVKLCTLDGSLCSSTVIIGGTP